MSTDLSVREIGQRIDFIRGHRVMLDSDLAELYGVETRVLNHAVRRNLDRFPGDFMFKIDRTEYEASRSQSVILKPERGKNLKYPPLVFTEQG